MTLREQLDGVLSLSLSLCVGSGIELRSPRLFSKPIYFYPVNHFKSPDLKLQTLFEVLGSQACAAMPGKVLLLVKGCVL